MTENHRAYGALGLYFIGASAAIGSAFEHAVLGVFIALAIIWLVVRPEHAIQRAFDRVAENPLAWAAKIFFIGILGGGIAFSLLEPAANIFDGMWWSFISMTTVGYGDISPKTPEMRIVAITLIAMGMSVTAIIIGEIASGINEVRARKRHEIASETAEMDDDIEAFVAYVTTSMEEMKSRMSHPYVVTALRRCHEEQQAAARRKS